MSENWVSPAATKASASEQIDSTTASNPRITTASHPVSPRVLRIERDTTVCSVAAVAPPITKNPAACEKSCNAVSTSSRHGLVTSFERFANACESHPGFPNRSHHKPTTEAAITLATNRAIIIIGRPGNATAVATSTTGLMAGDASKNAMAAENGTPRCAKRAATGTEEHSHPGRKTPATAATGTASARFFGKTRARAAGRTKAAITPERTTPNTINGIACKTMARKIVAQWANA